MRPNLSLPALATTLAALGTSAILVACGGDTPASNTPSGGSSAAPSASSAPADTGAPSASAAPAAEATPPAATTAAPAATPAPTTTATTASAPKKSPPKAAHHATGQASCGAGTCSSDAKKK